MSANLKEFVLIMSQTSILFSCDRYELRQMCYREYQQTCMRRGIVYRILPNDRWSHMTEKKHLIEAHHEVRNIKPNKSCKSTQVSVGNESSKQGCHPGGAFPVEHICGGLHSPLVQDGGEICDQV